MRNLIVNLLYIAPLITFRVQRIRQRIRLLFLRIEDQRIRSHFARAEHWLRSVDTHTWSEDRRAARLCNLDRLHDYWLRGQFPNDERRPAWRVPVFIDTAGHACAVASLMIESGEASLATRIAKSANYSAVKQMDFPELGAWVAQSGFTLDELARVQCSYPWVEIFLLMILVTFFGMGGILFLALSQSPISADVNAWVSLGMTAVMVFIAMPTSLKHYLKTRHKMELFALPAFLSIPIFLPSVLIFILTLFSRPDASSNTMLLSIFNMLIGPVSWGGLILTNAIPRKSTSKAQRKLQSQSH